MAANPFISTNPRADKAAIGRHGAEQMNRNPGPAGLTLSKGRTPSEITHVLRFKRDVLSAAQDTRRNGIDKARRSRDLEHANDRLKRQVADQSTVNHILRDSHPGIPCARSATVRMLLTSVKSVACRSAAHAAPRVSSDLRFTTIGGGRRTCLLCARQFLDWQMKTRAWGIDGSRPCCGRRA